VANYFLVEVDTLKTTKPETRNIPRMIAIFLAKQCGQLTYQKIADYFTKINADSIGMVINRLEKIIQYDEKNGNPC
jgi:chromosomal replication initiation ATPase DnaA